MVYVHIHRYRDVTGRPIVNRQVGSYFADYYQCIRNMKTKKKKKKHQTTKVHNLINKKRCQWQGEDNIPYHLKQLEACIIMGSKCIQQGFAQGFLEKVTTAGALGCCVGSEMGGGWGGGGGECPYPMYNL